MAILPKDEPNDHLTDSEPFQSKINTTGNTPADDNENNIEIIVQFTYLSNIWRTLEMLLINYKVNFILTWPSTCVITNSTGAGTFAITNTKLYIPVLTLSSQDNPKLLQQLKSGFKEQLCGINISHNQKHIHKKIFKSLSWSKFSRIK